MNEYQKAEMAFILNNILVEIPAGIVKMRDDRIKQEWTVDIKKFMLGKYPVTQAVYWEVMKQSPSTFKGDQKPVETVSWKEAVVFCNALSKLNGLEPCYILMLDSEAIVFNPEKKWIPLANRGRMAVCLPSRNFRNKIWRFRRNCLV